MIRTLAIAVVVTFAVAAAAGAQTFTKDVAPILQRSCQSCHRPGQMAPMSLMTYQDVRPWARSIKQRVTERQMPPWGIDPHVGIQSFKNDPSLREDEIKTIRQRMGVEEPTYEVDLTPGETVNIVDGPFKDFDGQVDEVDKAKGKIKVLVNMFGRETPVELDFLQVRKI